MQTRRTFIHTVSAGSLTAIACNSKVNSDTDPINSLSSLTKHIEPIPVEEFESRIEKLRKLMNEHQFEAFFAESGPTLQYFTDVKWGRSERPFAVIITSNGELSFICPAFEEGRARERIRNQEAEVRIWHEHDNPYRLIESILSDKGIKTGSVALEPSTRLFIRSGLSDNVRGLEFLDGTVLSKGCRIVKSNYEIECMKLANQITKQAYSAAFAGLKEGMLEQDLRTRISLAHSNLGAQGGAMVLFGPNSALPHGSQNPRKLQPGDLILVDGGCGINGYRSDITRTIVFGEPTDKQKTVAEIVLKSQKEALKAARPGVECQELDRIARKVVEDSGYGPDYKYFTHRLGHGIGLEGHEFPYLVRGNELKLEPGMSVSNEPGIYIPGEWGIRHEDIMVITEDGAEILGDESVPLIS